MSKPVPLLTSRRLFAALAVYFLCQIAWRLIVSDSVELDESEQLILAQGWNWGYSNQPPLYTWLQRIVFGAFGWHSFSLLILKFSILFGTFYFFYRASREATGEEETALVTALSLFFLPQIAWESQRDLTHSVLATCAGATTLFVLLRLFKTGRPAWYLWLGVVAGMGVLAKYNYLLLLVALLFSAASIPEFRACLFSRWLLASVLLFVAVTGGHFLWLAQHPESVSPAEKLTFATQPSLWGAYLAGFKRLFLALLGFAGPLGGVFALIFFEHRRQGAPSTRPSSPEAKWLGRALFGLIVFCVLAIVCFKARLKDRWFQPLLFLLPLFVILLVRHRMIPVRKKLLASLACLVALGILAVMPAIPLAASITRRPNRLNLPWSELAQLVQSRGVTPGVIIADSSLPAGNFKLSFPQSLVLAAECSVIPPPRNVPWLVVWEAPHAEKAPAHLQKFYQRVRGEKLDASSPSYVEAPYKYFPIRRQKLGFVMLAPVQQKP